MLEAHESGSGSVLHQHSFGECKIAITWRNGSRHTGNVVAVQEPVMVIEGRGEVQKRSSEHAGQVLPQDGHSTGAHVSVVIMVTNVLSETNNYYKYFF